MWISPARKTPPGYPDHAATKKYLAGDPPAASQGLGGRKEDSPQTRLSGRHLPYALTSSAGSSFLHGGKLPRSINADLRLVATPVLFNSHGNGTYARAPIG